MHTVKFALEQHKAIACVQHPSKYADYPQARGNAQLFSAGIAVPISNTQSLEAFWKSSLLNSDRPVQVDHELSLNGW